MSLVSVVVPTHRRPELLAETLRCVIDQRDVDLEVLVVDDVGDVRTAATIDSFDDDRLRLVANPDGSSAASSRNAGVAAATGEWVAFCDDDDLWAPDKLAAQLAAMERMGATWSCAGAVTVDPDLQIRGHERYESEDDRSILEWNPVPGGGSSVVACADAVRRAGGFDETLSNMEDWDMWIRLDREGALAPVDRPLVAYRLWPGGKSADVAGMRRSAERILRRHDAWPPSPEQERELEWYVMWKLTLADRRVAATRAAIRIAARHRRLRDLARVPMLAASPHLVRRIDRRRRLDVIPETWRAEADAWLAPLRGTT